MAFWDLFFVALVPVLETLLVTLLGLLIATERFNLLRRVDARNYLNNLVFYVFTPALLVADLAETITFDRLVEMWFMLVNIFLTFVVGSILGWMLNKIARTPKHLRGLVNGCCTAGNLGNLLLIIVPAVCEESSSPFGDSSTCSTYGEAYASVSTGVSAIFIWTYLYILMGASVDRSTENMNASNATASTIYSTGTPETFPGNITELLLPSANFASTDNVSVQLESPCDRNRRKVSILNCITWPITKCTEYVKLDMVFTPSTIAVIGYYSPQFV
ncbi:protein PIN-LIKES 3-like [Gastrolobium bilobum]|uniref:protein PIN-LIKES 3-like n=1 Tax=Gastrolobium bilobum TaxID=150636 RepID=UPI002AB1D5AD|nr:protein PIN-LIKES 3-like [Gastrolobium bilobum]